MEPQTFLMNSFLEDAAPSNDIHWFNEAEESSSSGSSEMETVAQFNLLGDEGGVSSTSSGALPVFASHPLASAKHICAICGDRASGKHYGVFSCEGCKGFFKRTVRKDLSYACREARDCVIDKRQRNRCQFCRYRKCQDMGMKREAVQEERQRLRQAAELETQQQPESTSLSPDLLQPAALRGPRDHDRRLEECIELSAGEELSGLAEWALGVPYFGSLSGGDQVSLLRSGWRELVIARRAFVGALEGLDGPLAERIRGQLTSRLSALGLDGAELGSLRTIVLLNPDVRGLGAPGTVEALREKVYIGLEDYCRHKRPGEPGRLAKLLLRLPALRSIGIASVDCEDVVPTTPSEADVQAALLLDHASQSANSVLLPHFY